MYDMDSRLDGRYSLPLIASDNWDSIRNAVTEVYGVEYLPVHDRRGRPTSESTFVPKQDLKYVQVVKERDEYGNLKKVITVIVYGDPVEVRASLAISIGLLGHKRAVGGEAEPLSEEL
ncbi:MAG: hypothetical protein QW837_09145 [Conexivisphaerales archaeon]